MSYDIDTEAIRRVARKIGSIATSVQDLSTDDIPTIERSLDGYFEGEAAKALEEVLGDLKKDVKGMGNGLKAIQRELLAYAKRVDEADEKAAQLISSN